MSRRSQLLAIWCAPALCVLFGIGAVGLAGFIPPDIGPGDSAEATVATLSEHPDRTRLGLLLMVVAFSLLPAWGSAIIAQQRRVEGRYPVLVHVQAISMAVGTTFVITGVVIFTAATFRPGELSPEIARFAIDMAWHFFLWVWSPFTVWMVAMALAILRPQGELIYPRWAAYVCLWTALLIAPAGTMTFFQHGAFAYNGLIALYVPLVVFFAWIIVMTWLTVQNLNRGAHEPDSGVDEMSLDAIPTASVPR